MADNQTIAEIQASDKTRAVKALVFAASLLVYMAGILYAEVHGFSLLSRGISPDFLIWAVVGMVALGITALAIPAGLHFWFHSDLQRNLAIGFYIIDLMLLFFNAVSDYAFNVHSAMPVWMVNYMTYIVPATPIIAALGWSILWLTDPAQLELSMQESLKHSARKSLYNKILKASETVEVDLIVQDTANRMTEQLVKQALGYSLQARNGHNKVLTIPPQNRE